MRASTRPGLYVCAGCALRLANGSQKITKRWIMGPKMLRKVTEAETQWQEQAFDIRDGKKKSMLSILEERGLVHDITGSVCM